MNPKLIPSVVSAVALATSQAQVPLAGDYESAPRNVVLVHGAFADGSGWRGVYDELTRRQFRVLVVQNPLTSLEDDIEATLRTLDRLDGPAILVGHSWGGTVITEAGIHPKVCALVYISALSPDAGETTAQQYDGFPVPPEFVIETLADGFGMVRPENFKAGFAADASDADVSFLRDSQVPIRLAAFDTKIKNAAWRTKPSWALIATDDKAFDIRMLRKMAQRIGAETVEVSASHAVFMTQPRAVADLVERAAKSVGEKERKRAVGGATMDP